MWPMQARGLWGPRHIVEKVVELLIPQFEAGNEAHQQLAKLGMQCSTKVENWQASGGPGKTKHR